MVGQQSLTRTTTACTLPMSRIAPNLTLVPSSMLPTDQATVPACPVCSSVKRELRWVVPRWQPPLRVSRCAECGLCFLDPIPDEAALKAYYNEGYYEGS